MKFYSFVFNLTFLKLLKPVRVFMHSIYSPNTENSSVSLNLSNINYLQNPMSLYLLNTAGLCCRFVTHARHLQTAQVPVALMGGCEILDCVARAFKAEVTWRKELEFDLQWVKGLCIQPPGSCQADK